MGAGGRMKGRAARPAALPRRFRTLTVLLVLATLPMLPPAIREGVSQPLTVLGWTLLLSLGTFLDVTILPRQRVVTNLRSPVSISTAVLLAPPLALLVNLLAMISPRELRGQVRPWMALFNHLQTGLAALLASLVAHALPLGLLPRTAVAVVVFQGANTLAVALAAVLLGRLPLREIPRAALPYPLYATNFALIGLLAVLTVVLHAEVGPWAVALGAIPIWLGYEALRASKQADDRGTRVRQLEVVNQLGRDLLAAREAGVIAGLARTALQTICGREHEPGDVVVALDGKIPDHLDALPVPGSDVRIGVPRGLCPEPRAEAEAVAGTVGLALQRRALEEELSEAQRARAELAERILVEGAAARDRLALHVHDGVLPVMAGAQIHADNTVYAAENGDLAVTTRLSRNVREAVEHSIATLRSILNDLQWQALPPGQLLPAMRRLAGKAHIDYGLTVDLDFGESAPWMPPSSEILLADAMTSLLRNVEQHAHAERVWIRLSCDDGFAAMAVTDDGVGFDPCMVPPDRGLALLRERVELIHGCVTIDTAPSRGTTVRVLVPLARAAGVSRRPLRDAG